MSRRARQTGLINQPPPGINFRNRQEVSHTFSVSPTTQQEDKTIQSVDLSKAICFANGDITNPEASWMRAHCEIIDPTTLRIYKTGNAADPAAMAFHFGVMEIENARQIILVPGSGNVTVSVKNRKRTHVFSRLFLQRTALFNYWYWVDDTTLYVSHSSGVYVVETY